MVFEYTVKHNGIVYPAGAEVPVGKQPETKAEPKVVEVEKPTPKPKAKPKSKK